MTRIEASEEFAKEVASLKNDLACELQPDVNNGPCANFRAEIQLLSVSRGNAEFAMHTVQEVPVVCLHCIGVSQGRWAPGDLVVKKEDIAS